MDSDPHAVRFYNLDGRSYSNSFKWRLPILFRGFTLTAAYRYTGAKTDYRNEGGCGASIEKAVG